MTTTAPDRLLLAQFNPHHHYTVLYTDGVTCATSAGKLTLSLRQSHPHIATSDQPIYPDFSAPYQPHPHMANPPYLAAYTWPIALGQLQSWPTVKKP